ncbi:hypothetical protein QMU90_000298 [Edwardsiella ictaluri]|uniref:Uncharacterized protein n=1 Tax=Edwardsiella ictaluri TaxID=67780 RepID=A0ABY8GF84_EDWIC|nr:hypothetical protein [Edwardsiella ictaluri]ELV7526582.1 hypothetical protein [Edwardsiella ictaluri]KMQ79519.1 hypothetical protein ABY58_02160 [Edwardsiella ictaluri]KOO56146.1 hypothetical protein ACS33_02745 [Edwardsiella ictaluri]WFN96017.1 hypothetical protein MAY91_14525 [Edwardsiella ictaluri]
MIPTTLPPAKQSPSPQLCVLRGDITVAATSAKNKLAGPIHAEQRKNAKAHSILLNHWPALSRTAS